MFRKLLVFLVVLSLVFMGVAPSVFAVTYANVGPTTNFDDNVGVPSGSAYYINEVLVDLEDIGTAALIKEAMFDADVPANLDILIYSTGGTDFLWKTPSELITGGTLIAWDGTTLNVVIPAEHIDSDMYIDGSIDHEHLAVDVITGWTADTLAAADLFLFHDNDGADLNKITWDNLMATISKVGTVTSGTLSTGAVLADVTMTLGSDADNDIYYRSSSKLTRLASNANADNRFLRTISAGVPSYELLAAGDIPDISGTYALTGANTDITSLTNTALTVGRDATNFISFAVDNTLTIEINDVSHGIISITDGAGDNDKLVTQGYVDDAAGVEANYILHCMDIDAADTDYIATVITSEDSEYAQFVKHPDFGRNITVTGNNVSSAGTVTITGCLAVGTLAQTEGIILNGTATVAGAKAFVTVTAIEVVNLVQGFTVGIGDVIGLPNAISAEADIYMKTVDGLEEFTEISGNGDLTNNTLDCATIVQNEDITLYYHN